MIVQFRNEKVSNHGSIPITIDCNVVAFIVSEEGFHQPIKRTKQSVFLDVTVFRDTLVVYLRHGGTLNSRRAASSLVRLVEGEERREAPDHSHGVLPQHWGWKRAKSFCHLYGAQSYD
ncbi:hypothetical protein TNCV_1374191 [Trichonephila clavipes]|nr:hypothetical protein TNCV_1374191 [Trichonephila clavipes]